MSWLQHYLLRHAVRNSVWILTVFDMVPPERMSPLFKEIRHNPLLWLLAFVPVALGTAKLEPEAHTVLFLLSVLAMVRCWAHYALPNLPC